MTVNQTAATSRCGSTATDRQHRLERRAQRRSRRRSRASNNIGDRRRRRHAEWPGTGARYTVTFTGHPRRQNVAQMTRHGQRRHRPRTTTGGPATNEVQTVTRQPDQRHLHAHASTANTTGTSQWNATAGTDRDRAREHRRRNSGTDFTVARNGTGPITVTFQGVIADTRTSPRSRATATGTTPPPHPPSASRRTAAAGRTRSRR